MASELLFIALLLVVNVAGFSIAVARRYSLIIRAQRRTIAALHDTIARYAATVEEREDWEKLFSSIL